MERLTDIEVIAGQVHPIPKLELQNPSGLEKIVSRLQEIEDILGDTYDLDRLRELVEENKKSRARKCPKCGRMRLYPRIDWKYFYCYSCETTFPAEEIIRPKGTITKGAAK